MIRMNISKKEVSYVALPKLTPEEKKAALKKAQEVRSKRAEVRRSLKQGNLTLDSVLVDKPDNTISRMRVAYLLESLPRVGRVKAQKLMEEVGIHEARRVQGLGSRQKEALLARLAK